MSGNNVIKVKERTISHIGRKHIPLPKGVQVKLNYGEVVVIGPKGTLKQHMHSDVKVEVKDSTVVVSRISPSKLHHSLHGLTRALIANAVIGVTEGYQKTLQIMGVGYRVQQAGQGLVLNVGYSHSVEIKPPSDVTVVVEGNNRIHVQGVDKQKVGEIAAKIRRVRPPNPYKEKGIRYDDEQLRFKPGKAAVRKE